jgi:CheY-like chemotaxis protein
MILHGGDLHASSEGLGRGSTFQFEMALYHKDTHTVCESKFEGAEFFQNISFSTDRGGSFDLSAREKPASERARVAKRKVVPVSTECDPPPQSHPPIAVADLESGLSIEVAEVVASEGTEISFAARTWQSGLRILVVDDSFPNRKVMKKLLTNCGHEVSEAEDGEDFLRKMGYDLLCILDADTAKLKYSLAAIGEVVEDVDVILIDDNMPVINGSDATSLLRKQGYQGKVLGVTGDVDAASIATFLFKGADAVLSKPIKMAELRSKIEGLLAT